MDMSLSYQDPMALLHGLSIWLFPDIPLADLDATNFEERLFDTVVQGATAPDLAEMKRAFRAAKVMVPRDLTTLMLFIEHFTVMCATLLLDNHPLPEVCFISIEEMNGNKKEMNDKLKKNQKLATQMLRVMQIQTNLYAKSVERGKQIVYPTFSTMVFSILSDQFMYPILPGPLSLQFAPGGGGGAPSAGTPQPTGSTTREQGGPSRTQENRVHHPRPHLPWKVEGRLKHCIDAAATAG